MKKQIARAFAAATLGLALVASASAKAPNIVFIMADDLDAASTAYMTQVKALITDKGTNFRRHYVSLSMCCPSRVAGLRGQYAHNTGVFSNKWPDGGFELAYFKGLEKSTYATWLKDSGYRTALFGKYLNGYPDTAPGDYIPAGWTEWFSPVAGDPHSGFNYTVNHNGHEEVYGDKDSDYMTDVLARESTDFIRRTIDEHPDHPFFAYIAPYKPHTPAEPAPRHAKALKGVTAPKPASFNEADVSDKPDWVRKQKLLTASEIKSIDKIYRKRRQTLLSIDELVENVVNTLQAKGQLENTYIFFTSDNGYHQGQHRLDSGKNTAFEEDILVPLSVRGPGVPARRTVDHITANVDYAGTFADIAGIPTPSFVDGRSLYPFLKGSTPPVWRQVLLLEHRADDGDGLSVASGRGVRDPADPQDVRNNLQPLNGGAGEFVGLRMAEGSTYVEYLSGERELYNNFTDPLQLNNIYWSSPVSNRTRLTNWVGSLKTAAGENLRQAELAPPPSQQQEHAAAKMDDADALTTAQP